MVVFKPKRMNGSDLSYKKVLTASDRHKQDETDDSLFYAQPRFVQHLDGSFRKQLTNLYEEKLKPNTIVLDLMSSWVSHLPSSVKFKQVIGHGLNKQELEANPHLNKHWVQNLNSNQKLPIESNLVDAVLIVAGWQYLQYPEAVSSELLRITSPNGIIIVSFSNRMFSTKAPRAWLNANDSERLFGISKILSNQGWIVEQIINKNTIAEGLLGLFGGNGDPFLSIIARATKNK